MAVNVSVFDLENFPSNPKTVTIDLTELVPFGNSGEDTWVFSAVTTATASGGAAVQRLYVNKTKFGWVKSSGLKQGPYTIDATQKHLTVAIDEAIGSGEEVAFAESITPVGGKAVAEELQQKISALAGSGGPKAGNLAYLNVTVRFVNGRFEIISGTAGSSYTGVNKSSVSVADGTTTTGLAAELGLDITFSSEAIAGSPPVQTSVATAYTSPGLTLEVATADVFAAGDCFAITDGTNKEFKEVESATSTTLTLASGLNNNYAEGSLVQLLRLQDPSGEPSSAFSDVDEFVKFSIASVVNQIDFSS